MLFLDLLTAQIHFFFIFCSSCHLNIIVLVVYITFFFIVTELARACLAVNCRHEKVG